MFGKERVVYIDYFRAPDDANEVVRLEVEFENEEDANSFIAPEWFGQEITGQDGNSNSDLAINGHFAFSTNN